MSDLESAFSPEISQENISSSRPEYHSAHLEVLRRKVARLKEKEIKLEADIAINERPELEQGIMELILAVTDCKRLSVSIKISGKPPETVSTQVAAIQKLILYYETKILNLKSQLDDLLAGTGDKYIKLSEDYEKSQLDLLETLRNWESEFSESGVNVFELLPTIKEFLPSDKLILRTIDKVPVDKPSEKI